MKLLDIQNHNSFTGYEINRGSETAKEKIRVRNNRNYRYELTSSRVGIHAEPIKKVETLPPYY